MVMAYAIVPAVRAVVAMHTASAILRWLFMLIEEDESPRDYMTTSFALTEKSTADIWLSSAHDLDDQW